MTYKKITFELLSVTLSKGGIGEEGGGCRDGTRQGLLEIRDGDLKIEGLLFVGNGLSFSFKVSNKSLKTEGFILRDRGDSSKLTVCEGHYRPLLPGPRPGPSKRKKGSLRQDCKQDLSLSRGTISVFVGQLLGIRQSTF